LIHKRKKRRRKKRRRRGLRRHASVVSFQGGACLKF